MKITFENKKLAIATKHLKERVISPAFEKLLKMHSIVPSELDTDLLGTFSGENERKLSPLETAREKIRLAQPLIKSDFIIASEGSFGPHPESPFIHCNQEILVLQTHDLRHEWRVASWSTNLNFGGKKIKTRDELDQFLNKYQFPQHGVIIKDSEKDFTWIKKDILTVEDCYQYFQESLLKYGELWIETDMRAHKNPTRMKHIGETAEKLIAILQSNCPNCSYPGFTVKDTITGLPCAQCELPTRSIMKHVLRCDDCSHSEELIFPHGKQKENPQFCDFCNP